MKTTQILSLTLTLLVSAPAMAAPGAGRAEDVVAMVNNETITREALVKRLTAYHGTANLEAMINQMLVRQAAEREKLTVADSEVDQRVGQTRSMMRTPELFQQWLSQSGLTEQQLKDQVRYTLLTEKLVTKQNPVADSDLDRVRASLILVQTEAEGREIVRRLKQGADFIQLAKEKSIDKKTGQMGGQLPEFMRADYPDLWQILARLKPGEVSNPVKLGANYAVARLEARLPASAADPQQRTRDRQRLLNFRMNAWLDNARKQAKVTYPVPLNVP
jgi:foldase protein PrsA